MFDIFGFLAGPLGWIMGLVYDWVGNYFLAIFIFTLIIRVLLFPFSLQSQKKQADRIRLAPRLERLQKKYKNDPQKLQQKQQALYEKEGVSLTGGCLPMIVQMIVLFGVIAVIYKPLTYFSDVKTWAVDAAVSAVSIETYTDKDSGYVLKDKDGNVVKAEDAKNAVTATKGDVVIQLETKRKGSELKDGYYGEMRLMQSMEANKEEILTAMAATEEAGGDRTLAEKQYKEISDMSHQFDFFGRSLLENPWTSGGFDDINMLWLIPLLSGLTAVITSLLSSYFNKQGMSREKQPGQGCSNGMMFLFMPLFSLYITFTVPGGVGVYWTCSNVIAILQTVILNLIYNPKKIREQAEKDYEERRRLRAEEKKKQQTLAEARRLDDERERAEDEAAAIAAAQPKEDGKKKKKKKSLPIETGEMKADHSEETNE